MAFYCAKKEIFISIIAENRPGQQSRAAVYWENFSQRGKSFAEKHSKMAATAPTAA